METISQELDQIEIPTQILEFGLQKLQQIQKPETESMKSNLLKKQLGRLKQTGGVIKRNISLEPDQDTRNIIKSQLNKTQIQIQKLKEDLKTESERQNTPHVEIKDSFEVIQTAKTFLEIGTSEQRKTILKNLGSNWKIKDQKLDYKPKKITSALKKAREFYLAERKKFELTKNQSATGSNMGLQLQSIVWSAWRESNPRH